jgi:hypothetical protein
LSASVNFEMNVAHLRVQPKRIAVATIGAAVVAALGQGSKLNLIMTE